MKVLICGADDLLREIIPSFQRTINRMGFEHFDFGDRLPGADNFNNWVQNSIRAVRNADIVIFVLREKSGSITWQHEYIEALNEGKPFGLLIDKELHENYYDRYLKNDLGSITAEKYKNAFKTLDILISQERSPIKYDGMHDFEEKLRLLILNELDKAIAVFQDFNKKKNILENIANRNYRSFLGREISDAQLKYFKEMLFDPFENKEIRKRVLSFFTFYKSLSDKEIVDLLKDSEQGVSRNAVDLLPELIGATNDKSYIINSLIHLIEDTTEAGLIRRSIKSVLDIDIKLGVKELISLFPAHDIGTPKRIQKWLLENETEIGKHCEDETFNKNLDELITLAGSYSTKPETLEDMTIRLKQDIAKIRLNKKNGESLF